MLDVAGGTGDISFRALERIGKRGGRGEAVVCDLTEDMLRAGRTRSETERLSDSLSWVTGDAMGLPFEDNTFDAYTISFGIRNVTRIEDALAEAFRVLKPGGRFLCLEFSAMTVPLAQKAYDTYSFNVIPRLGQLVASDRDSYQYLVESIRRFPVQSEFADMIGTAGFEQVKWRNMTGGIAALHSGWKL
jgi:demethylmenaquinone methyltransferase/2-methoxy-6-polyprenyl-1,4-benzoquinol methylase